MPEEAGDIAAVLPPELRAFWMATTEPDRPDSFDLAEGGERGT